MADKSRHSCAFYGMPARLKEISKIGVPILEDAAQAHGSDANWGRCGAFGQAAAFSFYPTKNLGTYGDGGMIVTSDAAVANTSRLASQLRPTRELFIRDSRRKQPVGRIARRDVACKASTGSTNGTIGVGHVAAKYRAAFRDLPIGMQAETGTSNYHLFVITSPQRDQLRAHLQKLDIPMLIHYPYPFHRQKAFAEFQPARCPNADVFCSRVLSLPMHAFLTDVEVDRVIEGVQGFFRGQHAPTPRRRPSSHSRSTIARTADFVPRSNHVASLASTRRKIPSSHARLRGSGFTSVPPPMPMRFRKRRTRMTGNKNPFA